MLVADIEGPVVAAAAHTPFESRRRVFVIEDAHTMNDQAANRLLKTLEEPPRCVHLILLAPGPGEVLPTIASRCQHVRFDPLSPEQLEGRLLEESFEGGRLQEGRQRSPAETVRIGACARLALGDAHLARRLTSTRGGALREAAEAFVRGALHGDTGGRPWMALLQFAKDAGAAAGEARAALVAQELELLPVKERKRHEREALDAQRRSERRARIGALQDALCLSEGAGELVYAIDRRSELEQDIGDLDGARLRAGVELVEDTRLRLGLNVSEELALEALAYGLQALLAS
jgi:DNA polymerase-3 subunit delta'